MSKKELKSPKVFISYSWTTPEHEKWVHDLVEQLTENGIECAYDKWDLNTGDNKYEFMESSVSSAEIDNVLMICDEDYKKKADNREGGVGTETTILTPKVYEKQNPGKFIPIIAQRSDSGKEYLPIFVEGNMYIDLSNEDNYYKEFERLIRHIFEVPQYQRQPLGKPPAYLKDETISHTPLSNIIKNLSHAIEINNSKRAAALATDYKNEFLDILKEHIIKIDTIQEADEYTTVVLNEIEKTLPLKESFVNFIKKTNELDIIDHDFYIEFFEELYTFTYFNKDYYETNYFNDNQFEHFKFLVHEMFLNLVSQLIELRNYHLLSQIIHGDYYLKLHGVRNYEADFTHFYQYVGSLEDRNNRLHLSRVSLHGDLIKDRYDSKQFKKIVETDVILYNISKMTDSKRSRGWFPVTAIYFRQDEDKIKFLTKLKSQTHFDNVKSIFEVESKNEFVEKTNKAEPDKIGFRTLPIFKYLIEDYDSICSKA